MELLLVLITGALCVACFFVGAKVGQAASKGEPIELPKPDPMKAIREHQERKQAQAEQEKYDAIMRNIENYDGTERGQEEVPRG
jgi:hypothetical protein